LGLLEDLLDLQRPASQRIAQAGAQILLQTIEHAHANQREGGTEQQRVPEREPEGEGSVIHSSLCDYD